MISEVIIKESHKFSSKHKDILQTAEVCGCFYCQKIFDPREIKKWIDGGKTALCPYCEIDSVIPGEPVNDFVTPEYLKKMHRAWFGALITEYFRRRRY